MSNKELEYSFICTNWDITNKQIIDWAWYKPKDSKNYTIADFYYDTKDRLLQQNKYVFRRRIRIQTVRRDIPLKDRLLWVVLVGCLDD